MAHIALIYHHHYQLKETFRPLGHTQTCVDQRASLETNSSPCLGFHRLLSHSEVQDKP